jgi:GxxExxY protein
MTRAWYIELGLRKLPAQRQVLVPVHYKGLCVKEGLRVDLVVGDRVLVETKSVEALHPIHDAQVLTYLRLTGLRLALLLNFNVAWMRNGIKRIVDSRRGGRGPPEA